MEVLTKPNGNRLGAVAAVRPSQLVKKSDYERLFDLQMQTLEERYCKMAIIGLLKFQKSDVIAKALKMTVRHACHIPFLPVIHRSYMSTYDQMVMVLHKLKIGYNHEIQPNFIHQVVKTPKAPYFVFDIEDGSDTKGLTPKSVRPCFKEMGRRGLTEVEIISLCIHTDVLDRHFVSAAGCRIGTGKIGGKVPAIYLNGAGPTMLWQFAGLAMPRYGIPSCILP